MPWLPVLWPAMKVPTFIDAVKIMVSFMFPSCLPSTCRRECDTFIAPRGCLCISDHHGVFTFICCQFCGKTGSYYTRKTLPYTRKEGGEHHFCCCRYAAYTCMIPADKNQCTKSLQCFKLSTSYPLEMIFLSMPSFQAIFFLQKTAKYHTLHLKDGLVYYVNFITPSLHMMTRYSWILLSLYNSSLKQIMVFFNIPHLLTRWKQS